MKMETDFNLTKYKTTFGKNFKKLREAAGYNQDELADLLGRSQGSISHAESGKALMKHETVLRAAELFNVHPMVFYSRHEFTKEEIQAILKFFETIQEKGRYYHTIIDLLNSDKA